MKYKIRLEVTNQETGESIFFTSQEGVSDDSEAFRLAGLLYDQASRNLSNVDTSKIDFSGA